MLNACRLEDLEPVELLGGVLERRHLEADEGAHSSATPSQHVTHLGRLRPPGAGNWAGRTDGSKPSRSRCDADGPSPAHRSPTPAASTSTLSPGVESRTRGTTRPGVDGVRPAGVPAGRRRRQAHAAEEAARRRLGRVEVAVGVDPQEPHVGHAARHGGQRGDADRAVGGGQQRSSPDPRTSSASSSGGLGERPSAPARDGSVRPGARRAWRQPRSLQRAAPGPEPARRPAPGPRAAPRAVGHAVGRPARRPG